MENSFLKHLFAHSTLEKVGDDGAVIGEWVYAMDAFVEGSHFKQGWLCIEDVVHKSLSVNVSDIYAMGAIPQYALLSIMIPKTFCNETIKQMADAIHKACQFYRIKLIGGDTISSSLLGFHWTLMGKRLHTRWVFRNRVRIGDLLCYSGRLGRSYQSLKQLLRDQPISHSKRHENFYAKQVGSRIIPFLSRHIHAGMDISDGLYTELHRLSCLNKVSFRFLKPLSKHTLISGEEYEALLSVSPKHWIAIKRIAKKHRIPLNAFAVAKRGFYKDRGKKWH